MSAKLLSMNPDYRHRFADELESMLYVTLYCCIRWIPHKELWKLGYLVKKFFFWTETVRGVERGDMMKSCEAQFDRRFTIAFDFSFEPIQRWILDMYDLLEPVYSRKRMDVHWNEESIERLWYDMVELDLPDGDRVDHRTYGLLDERPRPYDWSRAMQVHSHSSSSSSSKRSCDDSDEFDSDRSSKRQRRDFDDGDGSFDASTVDGDSDTGEVNCEHSNGEDQGEANKTSDEL